MTALSWIVVALEGGAGCWQFHEIREVVEFVRARAPREGFLIDVGEASLELSPLSGRDSCGAEILVTHRAVALLETEECEGLWAATLVSDSGKVISPLYRVTRQVFCESAISGEVLTRERHGSVAWSHSLRGQAARPDVGQEDPLDSDTPLRSLPISGRLLEVLERLGLTTVQSVQESKLWSLFEAGELLGSDAKSILREMSIARIMAWERKRGAGTGGTLSSLYERALTPVRARARQVFEARHGRQGPVERLQQIADRMTLSRERVRQLEMTAATALTRSANLRVRAREAVRAAFEQTEGPLFADLLPLASEFFAWPGVRPEFLASILCHLTDDEFRAVNLDGRCILVRSSLDDWDAIIQSARSLVVPLIHAGITEITLPLVIEGVAASMHVPELNANILAVLSRDAEWGGAAPDGSRRLISLEPARAELLRSVLEASSQPMGFAEIRSRLESLQACSLRDHQVRRALTRVGAKVFGRGVYGLWKHLPLKPEEVEDVVSDAESLVERETSARQWHTSEIAEMLGKTNPLVSRISIYDLNVALEASERLEYLGRFVWRVREDDIGPTARLGIHELAVGLLRDAGKPLRGRDLRASIRQIRGLNSGVMLLAPGDGLARLDVGTWGLIDRDFGPEAIRAKDLDLLSAVLKSRGAGLHEDEIGDIRELSGDLSPRMLIGLAQADSRFRFFRGGYIGCAEWESSRRLTFSEALYRVLALIGDVLPETGRLQELVEAELGRPASRDALLQALGEAGYEQEQGRLSWVYMGRAGDAEE